MPVHVPESSTAWATSTKAQITRTTRSTAWFSFLLTAYNQWRSTTGIGSWTGTRYMGLRVPIAEVGNLANFRIAVTTLGNVTAFGSELARSGGWVYYSVAIVRPVRGNATATIQEQTTSIVVRDATKSYMIDSGKVIRDLKHVRVVEDVGGIPTPRALFTRSGLPHISSFTLTPDHYRDTDKTHTRWELLVQSQHVLASMSVRHTLAPQQSQVAGYTYNETNPSALMTSLASSTEYVVVRISDSDRQTGAAIRINFLNNNNVLATYYEGVDGTSYVIGRLTYWVVSYAVTANYYNTARWQLQYSPPGSSTLGNLVMAFDVTGSVRNVITQKLGSAAPTNIPLSPSTGATITAPEQDATYTLTCYNSLNETSTEIRHYTYWTEPTLTVADAERVGAFRSGRGGTIRFNITRGGNPLPTVSVVASDGHGSTDAVHFTNAHRHDAQLRGFRSVNGIAAYCDLHVFCQQRLPRHHAYGSDGY